MPKAVKNTIRKKTVRLLKARDKAIVIKGATKSKGTKTFSFSPVSAKALSTQRNKAYQYFSIR